MGGLGVLTDVTFRAVERYKIKEVTRTVSRKEAVGLLRGGIVHRFKHCRFMWIPYEDKVIVVTGEETDEKVGGGGGLSAMEERLKENVAKQPLVDLVRTVRGKGKKPEQNNVDDDLEGLSFADLRQLALMGGEGPLDVEVVKAVNRAEGMFWSGTTEGGKTRVGWNEQVLQFDCGGSQEVLEVCFPVQDQDDVTVMLDLLEKIETGKFPAPGPIEQRWSAGSNSVFSPASFKAGDGSDIKFKDADKKVFSWVGVIMYLPLETEDDEDEDGDGNGNGGANLTRNQISTTFANEYTDLVYSVLPELGVPHWAKILVPGGVAAKADLKSRIERRYPVDKWRERRMLVDPERVLGNGVLDFCFEKE